MFWKKAPSQAFQEWLKKTGKEQWSRVALEVNSSELDARILEIHTPTQRYFLRHGDKKKNHLEIGENDNFLYRGVMDQQQAFDFTNAIQEGLFAWAIKAPQKILDQAPDDSQQYLIEQEQKAFMWLQASFQVLENALKDCLENSDQNEQAVFQGKIFAGAPQNKSSSSEFHWRLILFNLDFILDFHVEKGLEVQVFKTANSPNKTPDLHAVFQLRKREVYDLFVQQLNLVSKASILKPL